MGQTTSDTPMVTQEEGGSNRFSVIDAEGLSTVTSWLHDCFFCVSSIEWDRSNKTLWVPYSRENPSGIRRVGGRFLKRFEIPKVACDLWLRDVVKCEIGDQQGIDCYDFNELRWDGQTKRIVIETNIPNVIWCEVTKIDVELEITDREVGQRVFRSFFG